MVRVLKKANEIVQMKQPVAQEVVQCYTLDPIMMKHVRREKRLVAFSRVELQSGERVRHVRLILTASR